MRQRLHRNHVSYRDIFRERHTKRVSQRDIFRERHIERVCETKMPWKKRSHLDPLPNHKEVNYYQCCPHSYDRVKCMANHYLRVHKSNIVECTCNICGTLYSCQALLADHKTDVHVDNDGNGRLCINCGTFAR